MPWWSWIVIWACLVLALIAMLVFSGWGLFRKAVAVFDELGALGAKLELLDAAITDGANTLNGLTFGLAEERPVEDEARKQAVADAVARAKLLAEAAGEKLGPIVSITEGGTAQPYPGVMFKAADSARVPVAAGEVGISSTVTIVWQLSN